MMLRELTLLFFICSGTFAEAQVVASPAHHTYTLDGKVLQGALPGRDATKPSDPAIAGAPVFRRTDVDRGTLTLYPGPTPNNGTVLVLPGGGYHVLADDLEGTEVCAWLNRLGLSAALLRYRVPSAAPNTEPLEDAKKALALMVAQGKAWQINTSRIAVLGFSAGADLAARLTQNLLESTTLRALLLIYPAYLATSARGTPCSLRVRDDLQPSARTPPTFLLQAEDDPVDVCNSYSLAAAMRAAHRPAELHTFAEGGHGYGIRRTPLPISKWTTLAERFLSTVGMLPMTSAQE